MKRTSTGTFANKNISRGECRYKEQCYRKNPTHFQEYSHKHLTNIINNSTLGADFDIPSYLIASGDIIKEQLQIIIDNNILPIKRNTITIKSPATINRSVDNSINACTSNTSSAINTDNIEPSTSNDTNNSNINSISKLDNLQVDQETINNIETRDENKVYDKRTNSFKEKDTSEKRRSKTPEPRKVRNIIPDNCFSVMAPKGKFAAKLEAAAPYNFFLTTIADNSITHNEPLSVTFTELLDRSLGELESSVQINFMVDIGWLMAHYVISGNSDTPLLILYGEEDPELQTINKKAPHITAVHVKMATPFGKHHTKMSLLGYKDGSMRVVISTANLYEPDWENRTQGLWVSPKLPAIETVWDTRIGESETGFRDDLLRYLISYKIPQLQSWISRIRKTDFSSVNVFLIPSIPGSHRDLEQSRYGHTRLASLLSKHVTAKAADTVIAQSSSIGSLGPNPTSWAGGEFLTSLSKVIPSSIEGPRSLPPFKMIYPSLANVRASHDGLLGGGCLPYSVTVHSKQTWLMNILHQWRAKSRHRTRAMPHIKTYCRISGPLRQPSGLHWFLLSSANLSKAAWGARNKAGNGLTEPPLRIMSYELGVLFLPKIIICKDLLPLESTSDVKAFPLPYDLPLTPYNPDDTPFFMDILQG